MTPPAMPTRPADHPPIPPARVGVLIVNLGTPDAPEAGAVKRYLREFLSDRRVVEIPPYIWQPILRGIILRGATFMDLWEHVAALVAIALVLVAASSRAFRKTMR